MKHPMYTVTYPIRGVTVWEPGAGPQPNDGRGGGGDWPKGQRITRRRAEQLCGRGRIAQTREQVMTCKRLVYVPVA